MEVLYPITFDYIKAVSGETLKVKVLSIGDWNMDTVSSVTVAHGLGASFVNIRQIDVIIRSDNDLIYSPLTAHGTALDAQNHGGVSSISNTIITLFRLTGGIYGGVGYDSVGFNRGWVTIWYVG